MQEPDDLTKARDHLAKAEAMLMTPDGLLQLQEGLAFLDALVDGETGGYAESATARNLGRTYTSRIYERVRREGEKPNLAEPELEHLFAVLRAFDDTLFELPPGARELKISVVARLLHLYSEGSASAEKEKLFERLAGIAAGDGPAREGST